MTPSSIVAGVAAYEAFWWARRYVRRQDMFALARAEATRLGKPLVVIGAPDGGFTSSPAGDLNIDIAPSSAPNFLQADITKPLPLQTDSCVVYVACVLECVDDLGAAVRELMRISGGHLFVVRTEPWTLTAFFYPGIKRTLWSEITPESLPAGAPSTISGLCWVTGAALTAFALTRRSK